MTSEILFKIEFSSLRAITTRVSGHYLVEKCCANAFPDDVPVRPTRDHLHFLLLHDFLQLRPNLSDLTHGFAVDEVVRAPLTRISVAFPLVQEGQMRRLHSHLHIIILSKRIPSHGLFNPGF